MKTALLLLTYSVGIGELILAIYFWATNSKNEIRRVMALISFSLGMWLFLVAIIAYNNGNWVLYVDRIVYAIGAILLTAVFHLTVVYPYKLFSFDRLHIVLLYIPAFLLAILSIFTPAIIKGVILGTAIDSEQDIGGVAHPLYNGILLTFFLLSIGFLFFRLSRTSVPQRNDVKLILTSLILGGAPSMYVDVVAPLFGFPVFNYLYGSVFTGLWLGVVIWILFKKT